MRAEISEPQTGFTAYISVQNKKDQEYDIDKVKNTHYNKYKFTKTEVVKC